MESLYEKNGLLFWTQEEIRLRNWFEQRFSSKLLESLLKQNSAFQSIQVEAPLLTPNEHINKNYGEADVYRLDDLTLRPETTMGSYLCAKQLLSTYGDIKYRPPIIVWQHGKSFRREQDQPTKFMRLKEFYQLEFQIIYGLTTKNDYAAQLIPEVQKFISEVIGACRVENSDRLPEYSEITVDVVCEKNDMEVCSISKRKDFEGYKVLEVAIGTDRCLYNYLNRD